MTDTTTDTVIGEITKNQNERLRVSITRYRTHDLIAQRVFYDADGDWKPGKQGLSIRITLLPALLETLTEALVEARRRGLVQ